MPCVIGKNSISCFRLSHDQQSRIMSIFDKQVYWSPLTKEQYDARPASTAIPLGMKQFIKSKTEFVETRKQYCERLSKT
jgi:hypothetical protein